MPSFCGCFPYRWTGVAKSFGRCKLFIPAVAVAGVRLEADPVLPVVVAGRHVVADGREAGLAVGNRLVAAVDDLYEGAGKLVVEDGGKYLKAAFYRPSYR